MISMEIRVSLFKIERCGYYSRRPQLNHEFMTLDELLIDLNAWSSNKPLRQTRTFTPKDGSKLLPAYLFDIKKNDNGNWLLVIWNETPSFEGAIASADGESTVGEASVDLNEIKQGGIPGFPSYFYIIPRHNIISSIRLHSTSTGLPNLREYLISYLEFFSKYVDIEYERTDGADVIYPVGYEKGSRYFEANEMSIQFSTSEIRNPGKLEYMRRNVHKVSKVLRKMTLDLDHQIQARFLRKLLKHSGINRRAPQQPSNQKIKIKYELQDEISLNELNDMIEKWEDSSQDRAFDDYGLVMRGEKGQPLWFSSSKASGELELNVVPINDAILDTESLLRALTDNEEQILQLKS